VYCEKYFSLPWWYSEISDNNQFLIGGQKEIAKQYRFLPRKFIITMNFSLELIKEELKKKGHIIEYDLIKCR